MMVRAWRQGLVLAAALAVTFVGAAEAGAQTIPTGDAQPFLGTWVLPLDAGEPVTLTIDIRDADGEVAASVIGLAGTPTPVTRISNRGEALQLAYDADLQGQTAPIVIRLVPEGDVLAATVNVAEGMMTLDGTATRKEE